MWESLSWLFGGNLADGRGRDFCCAGGGEEGEEWGKFGTGGRVEGWLGDGEWNERLVNGYDKFSVT